MPTLFIIPVFGVPGSLAPTMVGTSNDEPNIPVPHNHKQVHLYKKMCD